MFGGASSLLSQQQLLYVVTYQRGYHNKTRFPTETQLCHQVCFVHCRCCRHFMSSPTQHVPCFTCPVGRQTSVSSSFYVTLFRVCVSFMILGCLVVILSWSSVTFVNVVCSPVLITSCWRTLCPDAIISGPTGFFAFYSIRGIFGFLLLFSIFPGVFFLTLSAALSCSIVLGGHLSCNISFYLSPLLWHLLSWRHVRILSTFFSFSWYIVSSTLS